MFLRIEILTVDKIISDSRDVLSYNTIITLIINIIIKIIPIKYNCSTNNPLSHVVQRR